jgi:preprotein translocase subunit SecA
MSILKLFDGNEREIGRLRRTVAQVNAFEPAISALSDDELRAKTPYFRERLAAGE